MKGRVFGSALADYFWLVLLSEKTKTMQKTICPHLHTHFKWWLFTCFFKNVQMSDSTHNRVFNTGQVLSDDWQSSIAGPDLQSHLKCFQKFILVYCSAIQLCPEAFWPMRVDNGSWKSKMNWEVPPKSHLRISLAMPGNKYSNVSG